MYTLYKKIKWYYSLTRLLYSGAKCQILQRLMMYYCSPPVWVCALLLREAQVLVKHENWTWSFWYCYEMRAILMMSLHLCG